MHSRTEIEYYCRRRKYGLLAFLFDAFMTLITGGLWLIRIYVREMRGQ